MPSVPKRTPKTGSVLLGRELRRLRAGRTLREIVNLTKSPPLASHVGTLSEAGLSEVESGKTMPSAHSLHALSIIYRTSMSHLMSYVSEERLQRVPDFASLEGARLEEEFTRRFVRHEWPGALALALHGELVAQGESRVIAWRANRASCLSRMGLHDEALFLLTRCSESAALSPRQRVLLLHNLAVAHALAGHCATAARVLRDALERAARLSLPPADVAAMEKLRAELLVNAEMERRPDADERAVREALRLLDAAASKWQPDHASGLAEIRIASAEAHFCLGNGLVAARDLELVAAAARQREDQATLAIALLALATVVEGRVAAEQVARLLEEAATAAERAQEPDRLFEARFRLFLHHRDLRPGTATRYLRSCQEVHPLIRAQGRWVAAYEAHQGTAP